ncbi:hypothetical protein D3C76_1082180 [compost metagenome]
MIDPVEFGKAMGALVKEATAPLLDRIGQLEKQLAAIVVPSAADAAALVDVEALSKSAAALVPKAEDGKSVTLDDVRPLVEELVSKAVAALPAPEKGKDADMDVLKSHIGELVKAVQPAAPLPVPSVEEIAGTFERRFSDLTLSWERQARDTFEKAADRMPKPKDGQDALSLENFDMALGDDGRTITVKMQAGETVIEKSVKIAAVIDRDIFKSDGTYEKGDGVSYGGSFWIAKCDAPKGVPGSGETDWRCAVKKGRDGKDLRENASNFDPAKGVKL